MAVVRRSASEWQELVEEWEVSGMSRAAFARTRDVNPSTLGWWRWRLYTRGQLGFCEVEVEETVNAAPDFVLELEHLDIRVPCGFDADELQRLMHALC